MFVYLMRTDSNAFLLKAEEYSIVYMHHSFFIPSSVDGHLGCFHVLAIVNSAAMNNGLHVSFSVLVSSGYMPSSGIAGSNGGFIPSFLKNLHFPACCGGWSWGRLLCPSLPDFSTSVWSHHEEDGGGQWP